MSLHEVVWCTQNLLQDSCSFMWHQRCQHCKYTTSVDILKKHYKKIVTHVEPHASAVSLLKRVENKRSSINQTVQGSLHRLAQFLMPNTILADKMFLSTAKHTFQSNQPLKASLSFLISFFSFFFFHISFLFPEYGHMHNQF